MKITFIGIHPEFTAHYFDFGIFKRAKASGNLELESVNLRDFACDHHGTVDGRPYGGGDGMVMRADVLAKAVEAVKTTASHVLLPSPRGQVWTQDHASSLSALEHLIFVCPRFGGVDQRFIDRLVDQQFSLGAFIVSGGELPALMAADSVVRHIPGALGNGESLLNESFSERFDGGLEEDLYTRPNETLGLQVPDVLTSGDHLQIDKWKQNNRSKESPACDS